jgi:hypothetical protein
MDSERLRREEERRGAERRAKSEVTERWGFYEGVCLKIGPSTSGNL